MTVGQGPGTRRSNHPPRVALPRERGPDGPAAFIPNVVSTQVQFQQGRGVDEAGSAVCEYAMASEPQLGAPLHDTLLTAPV